MAATQIDLADRAGLKAQLPQARQLYESKLAELKDLHQEVEHLRAIVEHMAALAGESFEPVGVSGNMSAQKNGQVGPAQEAAAKVVNKARRPMRAREVVKELNGEPNAVGAALWAAARKGLVRKLGAGRYAPRDYIPPPDSLLPDEGGKK